MPDTNNDTYRYFFFCLHIFQKSLKGYYCFYWIGLEQTEFETHFVFHRNMYCFVFHELLKVFRCIPSSFILLFKKNNNIQTALYFLFEC